MAKKKDPKEDIKVDSQEKREIVDNITEVLDNSYSYFIQIIFSTVIATLGLLIDSTAVVIGAMILAPLFIPIIGIAIGIITSRGHILKKSIMYFGATFLVVVLVGFVVSFLTPIKEVTSEITARTNPTLLDLFIAMASSIIGVISVYNERVSQSAAGVAISLALLPPLATVGVGIAYGSFDIFWKSLLLFSTNAVAIVVVGAITLYIFNFRPYRKEEKKRWKVGLGISLSLLILLSIPLTLYLYNTISQSNATREIRTVLEERISAVDNTAVVDNINVSFPQSFLSNNAEVEATVYLPEGTFLTIQDETQITESITERIDSSIDLKLNIINTINLRREENTENARQQSEIIEFIREEIDRVDSSLIIENTNVIFPDENEELNTIRVEVQIRETSSGNITFQDKEQIEDRLSSLLEQDIELEVDFIPLTRLVDQSRTTDIDETARRILNQDLRILSNEIRIYDLFVDISGTEDNETILIEAFIFTPPDFELSEVQEQTLEKNLSNEFESDTQLDIKLIRFNESEDNIIQESEEENDSEQQTQNQN